MQNGSVLACHSKCNCSAYLGKHNKPPVDSPIPFNPYCLPQPCLSDKTTVHTYALKKIKFPLVSSSSQAPAPSSSFEIDLLPLLQPVVLLLVHCSISIGLISYLVISSQRNHPPSFPWWIIAICVSLVLLLVIIMVALFCYRAKRHPKYIAIPNYRQSTAIHKKIESKPKQLLFTLLSP